MTNKATPNINFDQPTVAWSPPWLCQPQKIPQKVQNTCYQCKRPWEEIPRAHRTLASKSFEKGELFPRCEGCQTNLSHTQSREKRRGDDTDDSNASVPPQELSGTGHYRWLNRRTSGSVTYVVEFTSEVSTVFNPTNSVALNWVIQKIMGKFISAYVVVDLSRPCRIS